MKIAYVLNTYPEGSHSFIRREIAALERRGHEVLRIAMRRPLRAPTDAQDIAETKQTTYILEQGSGRLAMSCLRQIAAQPGASFSTTGLAFKTGFRSDTSTLKYAAYLAEALAVVERCQAEGIAHIHAHFGTNAASVAMLASVASGIPYSFTVHGPEEFDRPEGLVLGTKIARSAFTVAISQFGRSQLCRWVDPKHWDKIKVVHCGIDPGKFSDASVATTAKKPFKLVNIGRFSEQKGQKLLLEAMAGVVKTLPDVHLTLIGDGELRPKIEAAIQHLGIGNNVTLAGWLNEDDVSAALVEAHALILPSFAEGLPMVVMEAMAAMRPVITTYIAGIPELVQGDKTGWLVPAGDVDALCAAITTAHSATSEQLAAMGQAGRDRVLERHNINQLAEKLESFFLA